MREYELTDVVRRRAAGETWAEIGAAYGRSKASAQTWFQRHKAGAAPSPTDGRFRPRAAPAAPAAPAPEAPEPDPTDSSSEDPFADPVRPAAPVDQGEPSASSSSSSSSSSGGSQLGEDAARAYLPLLFGTMDALAGAGAIWLVRRKLGEKASTELLTQARALAALSPTERMALEAALVQRLAVIELSPDEALVFTLLAIYASKVLAVASIEAPADQLPTLEVAPVAA